jgi:hypothetical protein
LANHNGKRLFRRLRPNGRIIKVKVKVSRNRPGVALRVSGGLGFQILMTFSEVVSGTVRLVAQRLNHYATPGPTGRIILECI